MTDKTKELEEQFNNKAIEEIKKMIKVRDDFHTWDKMKEVLLKEINKLKEDLKK